MRPAAARARWARDALTQPLQVCCICGRRLTSDRMCVVAIGAEPHCGLCGHLAEVQEAVAASTISAADEGAAMELLARVHELLRKQQ